MKKTCLIILAASLSGLAACDDMYDPTMRPDYAIRVVPTQTGSIAVPPVCPSWATDTKNPFDEQEDPQIGCANARNLALEAETPDDLVAGREFGKARGVTEVGAIKRYDNNQTRGLIWPGSETNAPATSTAAASASTMTGDVSGGAAPTASSGSSSSAAAP